MWNLQRVPRLLTRGNSLYGSMLYMVVQYAIRTARAAAARAGADGSLMTCARALLYAVFTTAVVRRNPRGTRPMQCPHADIFTVWASRIANSKCSSITTLRRSFLAIAVICLISSGDTGRNNSRSSPRWALPSFPVQPVLIFILVLVTHVHTTTAVRTRKY